MSFDFPKIYPITDTRLSGLTHAEQVHRLIDGGAEMIQLREKWSSPRDFYADAERAVAIARVEGVKIIINDRVDIALALEADGVHLGQDDLPPAEARKLLGPRALIGYSTHSPEQAQLATTLPVDYIALGPVFRTQSKENPDAVVGVEALNAVTRIVRDMPLVAIGGITIDRLPLVFNAGADSAAMLAEIVSHADSMAHQLRRATLAADGPGLPARP